MSRSVHDPAGDGRGGRGPGHECADAWEWLRYGGRETVSPPHTHITPQSPPLSHTHTHTHHSSIHRYYHTDVRTHARAHTPTHVHKHSRTLTPTHHTCPIHRYYYTHKHTRTHTHAHTHTHTHTHTHSHHTCPGENPIHRAFARDERQETAGHRAHQRPWLGLGSGQRQR